MDASEVEVAFRWNIRDICWDPSFLAQLPDLRRSFWVINGAHNHVCIVEVAWLEVAIDVGDLLFGNSIGDLLVQARRGRNDSNVGVGIKSVQNAPRGDLLRSRG